LSVVIPARNEERNLPFLLDSLLAQTVRPREIIVVNDGSEDRTGEVAASYAERYGVRVVDNPPLPDGWTGKTWALRNGYREATGDAIAFLDADLRLAPQAIERLLEARAQSGGVVSVVPFHETEKAYERLALIPNVLGVFAFTSPFEGANPRQGLYGSCIVTSRSDYEAIGGHDSVRSEVLDDLNLGARFRAAGIRVTNYIGTGLVSFRMYPGGIRSELEGFAKGAVLSTAALQARTIALIACWFAGLIVAESAIFLWRTPWGAPLLIGYALYTIQLYFMVKYVGRFGRLAPLLHPLSTLFFLVVMLYSAYQVLFLRRVAWKGRNVEVGGEDR
jgi:hypothetical protein